MLPLFYSRREYQYADEGTYTWPFIECKRKVVVKNGREMAKHPSLKGRLNRTTVKSPNSIGAKSTSYLVT